MACVYILRSDSNQKFYIGSSQTDNADIRLKAHNSGKTRSTKAGRPWRLLYQEKLLNYQQARQREVYLKTGVGRDWIKLNQEGWQSGRMRRS